MCTVLNVRENKILTIEGEHLTPERQQRVVRVERVRTDALVIRAKERRRVDDDSVVGYNLSGFIF